MSWCVSMTPVGGHSGGLIFQKPVHGNMMNVLIRIHKESLIFTARSDLCVCVFEMLSNSLLIVPDQRCACEKQRRDAFEVTVWIYCSFHPMPRPPLLHLNVWWMCGTTESHNDHILNRRWHRERARLSLLSVIWALDYMQGGRRAKRYDGRNADLDELPWLSNPKAQKNATPPGWLWTSKNNSIHSSVIPSLLKGHLLREIHFYMFEHKCVLAVYTTL